MKTLLRSTIIADPTDNPDTHLENFRQLDSSGLEFQEAEDVAIWSFVRSFYQQHHHSPDISTIQAHFERTNETSVEDRVNSLRAVKPRNRGDFRIHLDVKAEDRRKIMIGKLLQEASDIVSRGITIQGEKGQRTILQGPIDAVKYFLEGSHAIVMPSTGSKLSGDVVHDGADFLAQYDRVKNDPLAGVGQFTGIRQIDDAFGGAKKFELWTHAAFTGGLKCLAGDTQIWDASTGIRQTVKAMFDAQVSPVVHSLDESAQRIVTAQASQIFENGVRPIYKLVSDKGREIRVSGNHPFWTPEGWVDASNLQVGSWVGTPASLPNDVKSKFTDAEVAIVGYMLGDGHIGPDAMAFTNANPLIREHFVDCLALCGYFERPKSNERSTSGSHYNLYPKSGSEAVDIRISKSNGAKSPWVSKLRVLFDQLGLWGKHAAGKFIPGEMWAISDRQAWLLLSALWSTDGRVACESQGGARKDRAVCTYASISKQLVLDIQALLQRLGVPSTVSKTNITYDGKPYAAWSIQITTPDGITRFLTNTKIIGKEVEATKALESTSAHNGDWVPTAFLQRIDSSVRAPSKGNGWLYNKHLRNREKIQRDTFVRLANASGDLDLRAIADGDVRWERLSSIELDGEEMTYDLSVPGPANFVANGFITHNSTLMMNWAYTQAVYYGHSSLIFSLEMPYGQCRNILYAMHSCHEKFEKIHPPLEYQQIKEGTLDAKAEWFLREHVVPDFNQNPDYGSILIEVSDPEKADFTVADARARAETLYAKTPFNLLFIDHALLMAPRHHVSNPTDRLNEVIRDCKKMAMGFNKGMGMAVVILFQISREGYKAALKARGLDREPGREPKNGQPAKPARAPSMYVYNLSHLSYANECLVGDTPVTTTRGTLPIQDVQEGDQVWSSTGWKTVLDTFDQGTQPTWLIETDRGSQLEVTGKHRVRTLCDSGSLAWSEAQDLKEGDWVVGQGCQELWPTNPVLREGGPTNVLTDALSYILGVWHGDGVERDTSIQFTGNRKEVDLRDRIMSIFREALGVSLDVHEYPSRPGSFDLTCYRNTPLRNWFCSIAGQAHGAKVPDCILQGSRSNTIAFLKGLFDADGYINSQNIVGLHMKSHGFLLQVQNLLTRVGLDSNLEPTETTLVKTGKTYLGWSLRLLGYESRLQFAREIGFTESWKMNRLLASVANPPKRKTTDQVYPVGPLFISVCKEYTPYKLIHSKVIRKSHQNNIRKAEVTGLVARGAIQYLLTYLDSIGVVDDRVEALRRILTLQVMQVRSCEPTGRTEQVYDIEVGGDHEYATGPLLSHNCERSSDIVTATWLDEELAKNGQILVQCLKSRDQKPFEPFTASIFWPCRRIKTLEDPNVFDLSDIAESVDLDDII